MDVGKIRLAMKDKVYEVFIGAELSMSLRCNILVMSQKGPMK